MAEQETQTIEELGSKLKIDENGNFKTKTADEMQQEQAERQANENEQDSNEAPKQEENNSQEVTSENKDNEGEVEKSAEPTDSSLTDIASQGDEGKQQEQKAESDTNFDSLFSERIEKEGYVKREDLEKELSEKPATENELISELLQLDKDGVPVTKDMLREILTDYSDFNTDNVRQAAQLVKNEIMQSEGLDEQDAEFELQDQFEALFDEDADPDSQEYKRAKRKLSIRAKKALQKKQQQQEKYKLPNPEFKKGEVNKEEVIKDFLTDLEQKKTQERNAVSQYLTHVAKETEEKLSKVSYNVGEDSFEYEPTKEVKEKVKDAVLNWQGFMDREFIENNKVNVDKLSKFLTRYYSDGEVDKLISGRSKAQGKEEQFKETKNAKTPQSNPKPKEQTQDPEVALGNQLLERERKGQRFF